jgi:hypothetical protein
VLIDDVSLAEMVMARSVLDDISIFVIECPDLINNISLEGMSSTRSASHDICFDETERARVSCGISVAATNFGRCMSGSIRIHYTEMVDISTSLLLARSPSFIPRKRPETHIFAISAMPLFTAARAPQFVLGLTRKLDNATSSL